MKFSTLNNTNPWHNAQIHRPWCGWRKHVRHFFSQRTNLMEKMAKGSMIGAMLWFILMPWTRSSQVDITTADWQQRLLHSFIWQLGIPFFLVIGGFFLLMLSVSARYWKFQMDLASEYALQNAEKLTQKYPQFLPILQAWACVGPLTEREASLIRELYTAHERGLLTPGDTDPRMSAFAEFSKRIGVDQDIIATIRAHNALEESLPECETKVSNKKRL